MKNITKDEFAKIIKKMNKENGLKKESFGQNRIAGWGNITDGVRYNYPRFDWSYVRNYKRIPSFSTYIAEEMEVTYSTGTLSYKIEKAKETAKIFQEVFPKYFSPDMYEVTRDGFKVSIINPFFGKK